MKSNEPLNTTMPIQIRIKNISDKIYENVSVFDYKKKTNLIYSSINEPDLTYEDILRYLTSIRIDDEKVIGSIYIKATSEDKEIQKKQLTKNFIVYKVVSLSGMSYQAPVHLPEVELDEVNYVWFPFKENKLHNRANLLIGKLYPYTTIEILIYPSEETKFF